jgi:hypothetical protein
LADRTDQGKTVLWPLFELKDAARSRSVDLYFGPRPTAGRKARRVFAMVGVVAPPPVQQHYADQPIVRAGEPGWAEQYVRLQGHQEERNEQRRADWANKREPWRLAGPLRWPGVVVSFPLVGADAGEVGSVVLTIPPQPRDGSV